MSYRVDCPHTVPGKRTCPGCHVDTAYDPEIRFCEEGEVTGTVIEDSEGDPGVINGIHYFSRVEDLDATCGCVYTEAEEQELTDQLADQFYDDAHEGPDPDERYDRMREDGF